MSLLEVRGLALSLPDRGAPRRLFGRRPVRKILRGIDLAVEPGEALGIVGESGSGKTSLGRCLVRLAEPSAGSIVFDGADITHLGARALRPLRSRIQMIFQDPHSSLNPRRRIAEIVAQPLQSLGIASGAAARRLALAAIARVGLDPALASRFPHQLSGGQRQRIGIARAVAVAPALVVADEIVSGLDVSTQAQILALLRELRRDLGLALIFVSHDLSVVRVLCDRIIVLRQGEAVETATAATLFRNPRHPYTRALLDAIPLPEPEPGWLARYPDPESATETE
jgi:ABC-type oligopeptide transport system ATPase subunit